MCFNSEKYCIDKKEIPIQQMDRDSLISLLEKKDIELKTATQKLKKTIFKIKKEMNLAKKIQEGLMPDIIPDIVNLKSAAIYMPAEKVGGDLYDIIVTPAGKIAILIYDVSGHGVPAAIIGAMAKMLFLHFIEKLESPSQIFYEVNNKICQIVKTEQYLTAFLGLIDPVKNSMVYSRAGHVPPMVYNSTLTEIVKLDSEGFFIGHRALLSIAEYNDQTLSLNVGDKILFYTDGLTEGCNEVGKLYGIKRLIDIFLRVGSYSPENILDGIFNDQKNFRNNTPLRDDLTMLCIEIGNPVRK